MMSETAEPGAPAAARAVTSSTAKKTTATSKPKANILGAKKTKLGAKKVDSSVLDFDEAEKKAREEAERKDRLGYDPAEEATPSEAQIEAAQPSTQATTIHSPKPVGPGRPGGFGATGGMRSERSESEMDRLGMGVKKLGFGQVGAPKGGSGASEPMGFGATSKAPVVGTTLPGIPTTGLCVADQRSPQTTRSATRAKSSASKRAFRRTSSSARAPLTRRRRARGLLRRSVGKVLSLRVF